jgi:hypothetical protein
MKNNDILMVDQKTNFVNLQVNRVVFIGIEDRYWIANDCGYGKIIT